MAKPESIGSKLWQNQDFCLLANQVQKDIQLNPNDAEFLIRDDGLIVNVEGWFHPESLLVGEVLYVPDANSQKSFFGIPYRKVTLFPQSYEPIPYRQRTNYLKQIAPNLDATLYQQYFSRYKQVFRQSDFIAHLPSEKALQLALKQISSSDEMWQDLDNLQTLLGLSPNEISLGLTGSLLLGQYKHYHDLDIVFHGSVQQNLEIAETMRDLAKRDKNRRLFEGGKAWSIRFFNDYGRLMCTFFTYGNRQDAPLHDFSMEVIEDGVTVQGEVVDDRHSMYTPTILILGDVKVSYPNKKSPSTIASLPVVIYHTAARGDAFNQDQIKAMGALVEITQNEEKFPALCVIERNKVVNMTPPWVNYYKDGFYDEE